MITYAELPDGGRLALEEAGHGAPVLLLHAGIADMRMWQAVAEDLARDHHVIRYDARGFGRSSDGSVEHSLEADALEVLDACGVELAVAIGCSMGGEVAIELGLLAPDRIAAIVTFGPITEEAADADLAQAFEQVNGLVEAGKTDAAVDLETEIWVDGVGRSAADLEPVFRAAARQQNEDVWERGGPIGAIDSEVPWPTRLAELRCPVLAMAGEFDQPTAQRTARIIAQRSLRGQGSIQAGVGHLGPMERPAGFLAIVRPFLAGLRT